METVEFNQSLDEFTALGYQVVGASVDSLKAQQSFAAKYEVRFPLLSDESRELVTAYGVLKEGESRRAERSTVVIAPDGRIIHAYERVKAPGHAATVLADLQADAGAS